MTAPLMVTLRAKVTWEGSRVPALMIFKAVAHEHIECDLNRISIGTWNSACAGPHKIPPMACEQPRRGSTDAFAIGRCIRPETKPRNLSPVREERIVRMS